MKELRFPALILCLGALAALLPSYLGVYQMSVLLNLYMWVALTQSWTVFSGFTGYVSLGHVVFYGLGAYWAVVTWQALPLALAVPAAGFLTGLLALAIGAPVLRVRGPYFVILTFGIAELVKYVIVAGEAAHGTSTRLIFGAPTTASLSYAMLALAVATTISAWALRRSRFGQGLVAIREDEDAAQTIGVPVVRFKIIAYALSAIVPGMVGALMVLRSTYFEVLQVFNPMISLSIVAMAIIGGSDDARGPLLGALFLVAVSELLWANAPQLYMILLGLLLVFFVLFAPGGVVGALDRLQRARA